MKQFEHDAGRSGSQKLNPIIHTSKKFSHDTKAVIAGQCLVFRTIAGYAKGDVDVMVALATFFRRPVSHAFLLPASSIFGDDDQRNTGWGDAVTLDVGDQVADEIGRVFEIQCSFDRDFYLQQISLTH